MKRGVPCISKCVDLTGSLKKLPSFLQSRSDEFVFFSFGNGYLSRRRLPIIIIFDQPTDTPYLAGSKCFLSLLQQLVKKILYSSRQNKKQNTITCLTLVYTDESILSVYTVHKLIVL